MGGNDGGESPQGFVEKAKRALIAFVIVDVLIIAGVVAFYFGMSRPQQAAVERARDRALRANVAMETRLHTVEARAAMRLGDFASAREAAGVAAGRLVDLSRAVPQDEAAEAKEVGDIAARLELVRAEIDRDAVSAQRDLEVVEARLAALYPVAPSPGP